MVILQRLPATDAENKVNDEEQNIDSTVVVVNQKNVDSPQKIPAITEDKAAATTAAAADKSIAQK